MFGPLTEEYSLDDGESGKPLLDVEESFKVLHYYWVTDTIMFSDKRQYGQVATIRLLAALIKSRLGA